MESSGSYLAVIKVVGVGGGGTNAVNRMVERNAGYDVSYSYNGRTYNGQPSRSLYFSTVKNTGGNLSVVNNEITQGVRDMQLGYLVPGAADYVDASAVAAADWGKVVAVNINMVMEGEDKISTNQAVLQRGLQHIVTLRNRAQ